MCGKAVMQLIAREKNQRRGKRVEKRDELAVDWIWGIGFFFND